MKLIKQKDPADAEDLEKAIIPQPSETKKTCTQTKAQIEGILAEYGSENVSPPILNMKKWEKEKEEYIEMSFIEWGWQTNEEHESYLEVLEDSIRSGSTQGEETVQLKIFARALRQERAKFRKNFANEFKFSQKTMVHSVRYERKTKNSELYWFGRRKNLKSARMKQLRCRKRG